MDLSGVGAVVFDAVGTLLHPDPPAPLVYTEIGRRFGSRLLPDQIAQRFVAAFQREEADDRRLGFRTSETREVQRWRHIVARVLDDVCDPEACFRELFEHFSRPQAWRCDADAGVVLGELARRGWRLGLASNFDSRLRRVAAGIPALQAITHLIISSEVGWRKPAGEFFEAVSACMDLPPGAILHVGDDLVNDFEGARSAGLRALLLDPGEKAPQAQPRIATLADLLMEKARSRITLFVYGTLKSEFTQNRLLSGQQLLGPAITLPKYRLYDTGRFPGMVEDGEHGLPVEGELWEVEEDIIPRLDEYEGAPDLFVLREIAVADARGPVWAYLYVRDVSLCRDCGNAWKGTSGTAG